MIPYTLDELFELQKSQIQELEHIFSPLLIVGGSAYPEQYYVYNQGEKIAYIRYRHGQFSVDFGDRTILILDDGSDDGIMEPIQRIDYLEQALESIKSKL